MKKHKRLLASIVIVCTISTSGFFYTKNVQAARLETEFQAALKSDNYEGAKIIQEKISSDIVVYKLMNFNEKSNGLAKEQYEQIKTSYLDDSITYNDFNSKLNYLQTSLHFNLSEEEKEKIERIESFREAYRMAYKLSMEKSYKDAYAALKEISKDMDSVYKKKLDALCTSIYPFAVEEVNIVLQDFIKKTAFSEAMNFLENNKNWLSEDLYKEKMDKLQDLIAQQEKEVSLKKKEAEAQMKSDQKLASFLQNYVPNPEKEAVVSSISSKTQFLVWVDISSQTTNIFIGSKGKWKLVNSFLSSTGSTGNETPLGTYTIKDKGSWFFSEKYQQGGRYWVRFIGNYLFHSLPMNEKQQVVDPTLGVAASHGCVRLSIENSKWIYDNIPTGTTVYIK